MRQTHEKRGEEEMKWQGWLSIALLVLFMVTLFLPRLDISGESYVGMAEEVNEHVQEMAEQDGDDVVSPGAVSAAAAAADEFGADKTRADRVEEYDENIDKALDTHSMSNLFFGKWALTVDDTLYFDGAEFVPDQKIEDSGVQSVFKMAGIFLYIPVLSAIVLIVLCILNKRANGLLLLLLGAMTGAAELFWQFVMPGMIWSKIAGYVRSFTSISNEILYSDGLGSYTISSMITHFTSWGRAVTLIFALLFIVLGILFMTALKQRYAGSFRQEMPEFAFPGEDAGAAVPPAGAFGSVPRSNSDSITVPMPGNASALQMPPQGTPSAGFGMPPAGGAALENKMGAGMAARAGVVQCTAGQFKGSTFDIRPGEEFIIGRDPKSCQLILEYPKISRKHCGIKFDAGSGNYFVRDYSTNGTRLSTGGKVSSMNHQEVLPGTALYLATEKETFLLE